MLSVRDKANMAAAWKYMLMLRVKLKGQGDVASVHARCSQLLYLIKLAQGESNTYILCYWLLS